MRDYYIFGISNINIHYLVQSLFILSECGLSLLNLSHSLLRLKLLPPKVQNPCINEGYL